VDLDSAAAGLYGLRPGEFVSARDARAAEARRDGDKELAAAIKKLKRPSVSAWLTNILVRERPDEVERLLSLGAGLRQAQQQLEGEQLRALSQQRHQVVAALVQEADNLAALHGQAVSAAAQRELQETLEAALSDPAAAEALQAGRLTVALSYSGLGTLGLDAAPAPATTALSAAAEPSPAARREAEAELSAAERRRAQHQEELARAEREHDRVARRIEELSQQLDELRAQLPRADDAARRLRHQLEKTTSEVSAAEERLARARDADGGAGNAGGAV
jgi:chromosome segregation ATPase